MTEVLYNLAPIYKMKNQSTVSTEITLLTHSAHQCSVNQCSQSATGQIAETRKC